MNGNFFSELKRRNVYKVAVAYAVVGWLVIQVTATIVPALHLPDAVTTAVVVLVLVGFPIALVISWAFEMTPEGMKRTADVSADEVRSMPYWSKRKFAGFIVGAVIIAAGLLGYQLLRAPGSTTQAESDNKSIAVLPLVNTSGDPANEYFSDGLSEELIAVLAKIPGLKTIGRNSSFTFKGKSDDSRTIGQRLGVANLLEGSVRKAGDRVRIVAELISAADGRALWSDTYDRELKDVFAVQSEIATAVAEQLRVKLLGAPARSDAAPSNNNLEAYNALQQGRFYLRFGNEEGTRKATQFFEHAVQIDPHYALAYASDAIAWRQLAATWSAGADMAAEYAKARAAAQTALSLSPTLSEAHEALGFIFLTADFNFDAAETEFRKAEEFAPQDARPKNALSYLLAAKGQLKEAEAVARKALELDPLAVTHFGNLARILIAQGRYDDAEASLRKGLEIQPAAARLHSYLVTIDLLRGDAAAAARDAQKEETGFWRDYAVALAAQAQSDGEAAHAALNRFVQQAAQAGPFQIAVIYGFRKEPDEMFQWLDRAYSERDSGLTQLSITPFILHFRTDPRFAAICRKLNIPLSLPDR